MHCIKTAISILMYRFCKYYTMYVRLNCICSVYVIYLCPINVLILSDITRSFLSWKILSLRGPFLAGQWWCRSLKQEWKPWLSSGRFWFVIGIILCYSWSVYWCSSGVHGMTFSQAELSTLQAAHPPLGAAVQPGWSLNWPPEGCCCSDRSFFQVDAKFRLRWPGSCTPHLLLCRKSKFLPSGCPHFGAASSDCYPTVCSSGQGWCAASKTSWKRALSQVLVVVSSLLLVKI